MKRHMWVKTAAGGLGPREGKMQTMENYYAYMKMIVDSVCKYARVLAFIFPRACTLALTGLTLSPSKLFGLHKQPKQGV
jgi:hypothetical protein